MKHILICGGLGYIGSHTVIEACINYNVIIIDNLSNSNINVLQHLKTISNKKIRFIECDLTNYKELQSNISNLQQINIIMDSIIHFAALKSVNESVNNPLQYYENNIISTLNILKIMKQFHIHKLIFSSSATVYSKPLHCPLKETYTTGLHLTNPYGKTKHFNEEILQDFCNANPQIQCISLRYFNPIGTHSSGLIGDNPNGIPNNLLPYIQKVLMGKLPYLKVYGNNYDTEDGTGKRDYIHVVDLANAHIKALEYCNKITKNCINIGIYDCINIGTGIPYSVLDIIKMMEKVSNKKIPYKIEPKREGDLAIVYADISYAKEILEWQSTKNLQDMCESIWKYIQQNSTIN